ncbi:T9SS C-terminal target domain-containing protein, partial [Marinilabiliaceae bacterium JC017]
IGQRIQQASMLKSGGPVIVPTGIPQMDALNKSIQAVSMKRVFRYAGKHEAKHREFGLDLWYELEYHSSQELATIKKQYQNLDAIEIAEEICVAGFTDEVVKKKEIHPAAITGTNDPEFGEQWHYENTGQHEGTPGADISLLEAWKKETGHPSVVVSIVDGGIDLTHPDLDGNLWVNKKEIAGNNIDDDNNGYIDDIHGFNFVTNSSHITPHHHGTHVAGTVAAETNNKIGVAGVAGGTGRNDGVRLMSCQVFTSDGGKGNFPEAIVYGADNGAIISQNSWSYDQPLLGISQALRDAIDYFIDKAGSESTPLRGGIVIFAAGNDNSNSIGDYHWWPAYYDRVMAVSNIDNKDQRNWCSNYGTWVDIAAPGQDILSTAVGGGTEYKTGTSMACPHVSGVAALIASQVARRGKQITPDIIWKQLLENTDPIDQQNPSYKGLLGKGRLNAARALLPEYDPTNGPIADFAKTDECIIGSPISITSYCYGDNLTYSWHFPGAIPETSSEPNPIIVYPSLGSYSVSLTVKNKYGENTKIIHGFVNVKSFCTPSTLINTGDDYINDVRIGDIHYSSYLDGYADNRQLLFSISPLSSFKLEINLFKMFKNTRLYAWVDWNKNSVFEKDELTTFPVQTGNDIYLNKTIDVPAFVKEDESYTMRVRTIWSDPLKPADPCGAYFGETEDYTLYTGEVETINFSHCKCRGKEQSGDDNITNVIINTKQFPSEWSLYTSFIKDIVDLPQDKDIEIKMQIANYNNQDHAYGWIDWNRNSTFEDNEQIIFPTYQINSDTKAGRTKTKVTPPEGAAGIYAMRLRNQYGNTIPTPCGSDVYGEVEDYTINLVKNNGATFNLCNATSKEKLGDDYINLVVVNGQNYSSGYSLYTDNTHFTIDLGNSHKIDLSVKLANVQDDNVFAWIDWNRNNNFEEDETIIFSSGSNNLFNSNSLSIPQNADGFYALRIRNQYKNSTPTACGTDIYGEVEDYAIKVKKQTFTSINPNAMDNAQLTLFPNPVKDNLTIRGTVKENPQVGIVVYNVSGQQVYTKQTDVSFGEFSTTINFNGLPAGMYLVKVTVNGQETIRKVFK